MPVLYSDFLWIHGICCKLYFVSLMSSCLKSDMLASESSWRNQDKK
jgi:hypothetical protein